MIVTFSYKELIRGVELSPTPSLFDPMRDFTPQSKNELSLSLQFQWRIGSDHEDNEEYKITLTKTMKSTR